MMPGHSWYTPHVLYPGGILHMFFNLSKYVVYGVICINENVSPYISDIK